MEMWFLEKSCSHRRRGKVSICGFCKKEFIQRKNGTQKYCSIKCAIEGNKKTVKMLCYNCGKSIEKTPSKLKNSIHGFYFCSRECKEKSQSLKGNCPQIRPSHYGTSEGRELYRNLIITSSNPCCIDCGENRKYLLRVHHIDGNKRNNVIDNFEIVCANCHAKRHLHLKDRIWVFCTRSLTPREKLNEL